MIKGFGVKSTRRVVTGIVALVMCAASMLPAHADIYWTNWGAGSIQSAQLDGSSVFTLIPEAGINLNQVAVGRNGYIYWADYDANSIGRAKLDGSEANPTWLTANTPSGLAVSDKHIYWSDDGWGRVGRAKLDGSDSNPNFVTELVGPHGLAIHGNNLYIAETVTNSILRQSLSGGYATTVLTYEGSDGPDMLTVNNTHIYWTDFRGGNVSRAKLNGSGIEDKFIPAAGWTKGVAVDSEYIYWTVFTGSPSIGRAKLDGTEVNNEFVTGLNYPAGLALTPGPEPGPGPGPDPKPTPKPKKAQRPKNNCAKPPKAIKKSGSTVILKAGCTTTAGKRVRVKVAGQARSRGEVTYYRVIRQSNGKTLVRTYGKPIKLKITWSASGNKKYKAFKQARSYRA